MRKTLVLAMLLGIGASVQVNAFPLLHKHAKKEKHVKPAKANKLVADGPWMPPDPEPCCACPA